MLTLEEVFPPFALRISCGPLELKVLRDNDLPELVELVRGGIQAPGLPMPFLRAWHEDVFAPGFPDGFPTTSLKWWWTQRATFAPDEWRLAWSFVAMGRWSGCRICTRTTSRRRARS